MQTAYIIFWSLFIYIHTWNYVFTLRNTKRFFRCISTSWSHKITDKHIRHSTRNSLIIHQTFCTTQDFKFCTESPLQKWKTKNEKKWKMKNEKKMKNKQWELKIKKKEEKNEKKRRKGKIADFRSKNINPSSQIFPFPDTLPRGHIWVTWTYPSAVVYHALRNFSEYKPNLA